MASTNTSAREIVKQIRTAIATNPLGVVSVSVDGQTVSYSGLSEMNAAYSFWQAEAAKEAGQRPRVSQIKLSGF
jgi:hypothetical protein